jgi:crossover junction endodeoxyribonuclease RusA
LAIPAGTGLSITINSIALTLPVPPSVNHQYATVNGRRLLSAKGRTYKDFVGQQILVALAQSPHRATLRQTLQHASLSLSIHFFFASALRRDTDGGLKIAQDALCEGLGLNDNRVVETHLYKHQDRDNPRMEIQLSVAPSSVPEPLFPASLTAQVAVIPRLPADNGRNR